MFLIMCFLQIEIYTNELIYKQTTLNRFMLFATQNPPGLYGGRKLLSRAFRNRFIELKFEGIPTEELEIILSKRCAISESQCKKLVKCMIDLQMAQNDITRGKEGFITLRDLFKWADRYSKDGATGEIRNNDQFLLNDGFLLLAGRVRSAEEENKIEKILQKHFRGKVDREELFGQESVDKILANTKLDGRFDHVVWTQPMRR